MHHVLAISPLTANIYFPAIPELSRVFGKSVELINLTVTMYMVLQGICEYSLICQYSNLNPLARSTDVLGHTLRPRRQASHLSSLHDGA